MRGMQAPIVPAVPSLATRQRVIVVGYDGGPPARRALAWAARRAGAEGRLILVSATAAEPGALGRPGLDQVAHNPLDHARLVLDGLTLDGAPPAIEVVVADDMPSRALAHAARRFAADEIAIGGRTGHGDGDVAADLLRSADRPVVVVR
jgi:nucleotide-binding universal stress UspA family protein